MIRNPAYHIRKQVSGAIYIPDYLANPLCQPLIPMVEEELNALEWVTKRTARSEYFMSETERTYSYGNKGTGEESYTSKPFTRNVNALRETLNLEFDTQFNVCFLNKYDDQHQFLGWHADQFDGMREDQPIFVMSFGAVREIWVKPKFSPCPDCSGVGYDDSVAVGEKCQTCNGEGKIPTKGVVPDDQKFALAVGSLFIMPEGYQDTHLHKIPKHPQPCGPRISLTFRSFK